MKGHVEQLFHDVADLSTERRARYFDQRGIDTSTREQLEELLAFDRETNALLERDISQAAARALGNSESTDLLCGPYRLGKLLGRGGMGAVYLAERVDGEVRQRVAVKILRAGLDDPQLRLRFLGERQILATLSHPNIARLLDAGHNEHKQPYLAMEYVEGKALDVFAGDLNVRQKIVLFLKVCLAVSYLHRNLVVHRDLKPANILVSSDGEPKLLDFGIAKLIDLRADCTATHMRMMTPDYASPEQASGRPASTATDIYSLGAVLYKLLTGESPHRFEGATVDHVSHGIYACEITPPSKIASGVGSDLEFVLMKALRRDPQERYATVEQFADDLENYLGHRPILARKGDLWYRTRRFLHRYWAFVLAALLVVASLASGLFIAIRERRIAERRFDQLRQLSAKVIDLDGSIRALPGSIQARQKLVAATLGYLEGLRGEAGRNPDIAQDVADGYWRMARIQGVNAELNLGNTVAAEDSLKKAETLMRGVLAQRPGDRNALLRCALIAHDRMIIADSDERRADALAHAKTASRFVDELQRRRQQGDSLHLEGYLNAGGGAEPEQGRIAGLYGNIALNYVNQHMYQEGVDYAMRAVETTSSLPPAPALQARVQGLSILANALRYQGDLDRALARIQEARKALETGTHRSATARFFTRYGVLMREGLILGEKDAVSLNRQDDAIRIFEEVLAMCEENARSDPRETASRGREGTVARELGRLMEARNPQRAVEIFDLGIQRLTEAGNSLVNRRDRAVLLSMSSYPLRRLDRGPEARTRIESALAILRGTGDDAKPRIRLGNEAWTAIRAQADDVAASGNPQRALGIYQDLLATVVANGVDADTDLRDAPKLSRMYAALSSLSRETGNAAQAAEMNARRVALWTRWQASLPRNVFVGDQLDAARRGF